MANVVLFAEFSHWEAHSDIGKTLISNNHGIGHFHRA
jgi:hypothetical protein